MYRVTTIIQSTCKKLGIKYTSPNHAKILDYQKDINKLAKHYLTIKKIIEDLEEFEGKYEGLKGLTKLLKIDIKALKKIDHDLIIEARKIVRAELKEV